MAACGSGASFVPGFVHRWIPQSHLSQSSVDTRCVLAVYDGISLSEICDVVSCTLFLRTFVAPICTGCCFSWNGLHSILSRLFLGCCTAYCPYILPYQCLRGCCTHHKSHGMQSWSVFTNCYQTFKYTAIDCTIVAFTENRGWIWD